MGIGMKLVDFISNSMEVIQRQSQSFHFGPGFHVRVQLLFINTFINYDLI